MIRNYIKIAFRNLLRDRAFSILNLAGLSVGLASVIMIMAYVRYELSYDKTYSNYSRVYRLLQETKSNNTDDLNIAVPIGLAQAFQQEFPTIKNYSLAGETILKFKSNNEVATAKAIDAGADFFKLFNFDFIKGSPATALSEPGSAVITEDFEKKFFNGKDAVGTDLVPRYGKTIHISGIIKNIPLNSHLEGEIFVSLSGKKYAQEKLNWSAYNSMPQYVLINSNTSAEKLESQFKSIYKKYGFPAGVSIHLQPVTDIHLQSHAKDEFSVNSDIKYVYIFLSAALMILFIACVNYINLTTARSLQRTKEIGIRKVLGALKRQLIIQFLIESYLFFFVSTVVAIFLADVSWPLLSGKVTGYTHVIPLFDNGSILLVFLVFALGGLFAGAYPAFFLSSLQPVKVLKGLSKFGINVSLRKALVVVQFTISGILIISTIVIYQQLNYISNARLGFNKEHLITIDNYGGGGQLEAFKNELLKYSGVQSVTTASWNIGTRYGASSSMADDKDTTKQLQFQFVDADPAFIKTMQMHLMAGRNFSSDYSNDTINVTNLMRRHLPYEQFKHAIAEKSVILNEEAVKLLGIKNPIGHVISTGAVQGTIIGVVQNFNGLTLHQTIPAVIIRCSADGGSKTFIRLNVGNTQKTIDYIHDQWRKFNPGDRFEFAFADEKLQQLYTADMRLGSLFGTFATLAIAIGCLGLFGLISLTVQNRLKEIGIRKVLGASIADIANLVSVDFIKLVVIALAISTPVAWYLMTAWLQGFAYRINIHWWVFLLSGGIAVTLSMITLSIQSVKAAMMNPVKSLKTE